MANSARQITNVSTVQAASTALCPPPMQTLPREKRCALRAFRLTLGLGLMGLRCVTDQRLGQVHQLGGDEELGRLALT